MMFGQAPAAGGFSRLFSRPRSEGAGVVACAAAAPLVVLALAVAADYAKVSHFRSRVQLAADRASVVTAEAIARQPDIANEGDVRGAQIADSVFLSHAPRGAGTPTVAVKSRAAAVTATVGYAGVAPSNFGSALGYDGVSVDASSTSLARVADLRSTLAR
jgi:Flp pilus assembly protein TadG